MYSTVFCFTQLYFRVHEEWHPRPAALFSMISPLPLTPFLVAHVCTFYTHPSDARRCAVSLVGPAQDAELYTRWLQWGSVSGVLRMHDRGESVRAAPHA